jgi:CRISPR system Cascade subunit CasB
MTDNAPDTTLQPRPGLLARDWWRETKDDRAATAALRRCHSPLEALLVPATLRLLRRFPDSDPRRHERLAAIAAVLAHVRDDEPEMRIARAVGRSGISAAESAKLSEGRFRRLMRVETAEELMRELTRLVRFMGGRANVTDLAASILYWGDVTKKRWIFDYYAAGIAAPQAMTEQETTA